MLITMTMSLLSSSLLLFKTAQKVHSFRPTIPASVTSSCFSKISRSLAATNDVTGTVYRAGGSGDGGCNDDVVVVVTLYTKEGCTLCNQGKFFFVNKKATVVVVMCCFAPIFCFSSDYSSRVIRKTTNSCLYT